MKKFFQVALATVIAMLSLQSFATDQAQAPADVPTAPPTVEQTQPAEEPGLIDRSIAAVKGGYTSAVEAVKSINPFDSEEVPATPAEAKEPEKELTAEEAVKN
jgi:hypothetical protein